MDPFPQASGAGESTRAVDVHASSLDLHKLGAQLYLLPCDPSLDALVVASVSLLSHLQQRESKADWMQKLAMVPVIHCTIH